MKKYYFLLLSLYFMPFYGLFAQIQKGGHFISAGLNFSTGQTKDSGTNATGFQNSGGQFGTSVGYSQMVTNNWAVGGNFYYGLSRNTNDVFYLTTTSTEKATLKLNQQHLGGSLSASYIYPLGETNKWYLSVGGGLSYGFNTNRADTIRTTGTISVVSPRSQSVNLSFSPNIVYAFSKHIYAQAYLGSLNFGHVWTSVHKSTHADLYIYPSWGSFGFLYYW